MDTDVECITNGIWTMTLNASQHTTLGNLLNSQRTLEENDQKVFRSS
jgi:hypothetical protein